jgi:methionine-gamma-lyase
MEHYVDVINERRPGYVYGRYGNPTHVALHRVMSSLNAAEAAWSFASGMAAIHTVITSLVRSGGHVLAQRTLYGGTFSLLKDMLPRYGVDTSFVDPEADTVAASIRPETGAIMIETLANPTFRVADVAGIAAVAADRGVPLLVDNSVATPFLFRPLELEGVSLVVESTTKYVGGHSDSIGGCVAGPRDLVEGIRKLAIIQGTTAGAFEAWLALRGAQTLALRLERQCATALTLATTLAGHPKVAGVGYSGLPAHPDHARARSLFDGPRYGAMLALDLEGTDMATRVCDALRVARVGSSFGGLHTQVCPPAATSHRQLSREDRAAAGIGDGLVRVAVGGEDADDLVDDFLQALEKA